MTASDTLLYAADLELLYDAFNDLLEAEREELSNPERVARIVYKLRYDGMTDRYNQSKELLNKVLNEKV